MVAVLKEISCCSSMSTWKTTVSPVHFLVIKCSTNTSAALYYNFWRRLNIILFPLMLIGPVENRIHLDWPTRQKICLGIAKGLAYLHEESRLKIVHRDIKATNVLLDKDLNAKISDFGLAKLDEEENTHISTRIAGTVCVSSTSQPVTSL